jgi:hypothetical protein
MAHRPESDLSAKVVAEPLSSIDALQKEAHDLRGSKVEKPELIKVADTVTDKPAQPKEDAITYLAKINPDQLGPGMKQAREAAVQLAGEKDMKGAAASYEPKFEAAVKQSDKDYADSVAENWGKLGLARRDVMFKGSAFMGSVQSLNANIQELPEEKRKEVSTMVNLMQSDTLSPSLAAELRKEVGKYPDVLKSFDVAKASENQLKAASEALVKAQEPLLKAAGEQAMARYTLAEVKGLQGETSLAVLMKQEARELFNKTQGQIIGKAVESKPPLQA